MLKALKRLDRYFFFELAKSTFLSFFIAIVVLLALQVLRLGDFIIDRSWGPLFLMRMLSGIALSLSPLIMPIAFLFSLLLVFGRMSTDREFIAMQALGQSPVKLLRPSLYFGGLILALTFWACFDLGPRGNRQFEQSVDEAWSKKVMSVLRSGTFSESFLGMVIFADQVDSATQELEHVFIHDQSNFREEVSISAKRGQWIPPSDSQEGTLRLKDGIVLSQNPSKDVIRRIQFNEYRIHADFNRSIGRDRGSPQSMAGKMLLQKRKENYAKPDQDPRPIWIEIARRLAATFSCLLFVPLCFAMSLDNRRTAKSRAIFTGLIILISYWVAYFAILTWTLSSRWNLLRQYELLTASFIWIPNVIILGVGIWLMKKKMRLTL